MQTIKGKPEEQEEELTELEIEVLAIYLKAEVPLKLSQVRSRMVERGYRFENNRVPELPEIEAAVAALRHQRLLGTTARKEYFSAWGKKGP